MITCNLSSEHWSKMALDVATSKIIVHTNIAHNHIYKRNHFPQFPNVPVEVRTGFPGSVVCDVSDRESVLRSVRHTVYFYYKPTHNM